MLSWRGGCENTPFFLCLFVFIKNFVYLYENFNKMTHMEDLMRLKEARIDALQNELAKLKSEVEKLKADAEINNQFLTEIFYENR